MSMARLARFVGQKVLGVAVAVVVAGALAAGGVAPAKADARYSSIVIDTKTGKVLQSTDPDGLRYPASLTKIMTLYVLFEQMEAGKVNLDTRMSVSKHASLQAPSKLGLKPGQTISARDAIRALVTKSANDVAVVVAEHIGGTESNFAAIMTRKARALGMSRTTYRNASGLPNPEQRTTARDQALLGRAIQDHFPKHYKFFATRSFAYKGRTYGNHNRLLGRVRGVDGIKTGYTRASGFNLVSSVKRGPRHIVAVVMGGKTGRSRDAQMASLIKTHINRATSGKRTAPLIARAGKVPVPTPAPEPQQVAVVPTPAPVLAAAAPMPPARPTIESKIAEAETLPVPQAKPDDITGSIGGGAAETAIETAAGAPSGSGKAAHMAAYAPAPRSPWVIQIAAVPDERDAMQLLEEARDAARRHLAKASPYTEKVSKGDTTLYRARFAGFDNKAKAWAACKDLKRREISCLALPQ
ncbi:MAG: D-alanyl-D-alanine carboxypeptidase [Hyphomicrobiales bacterium]